MDKETVFLEILIENETHKKGKPIDDNRCQLTNQLALIIDKNW